MLIVSCTLSIIALYVLVVFRGRFWNPLLDTPEPNPETWPDVDVIVPARNEAEILPGTLPTLLDQDYPGKFRILLVDDHSVDDTGGLAGRLAKKKGMEEKLEVVKAPDLPEGWTGKVAAMQAGLEKSKAPLVLFTDADIAHKTFGLRQLVARAERNGYDLASLMVKLNCVSPVEKLLIPAFVFFFTMLYPFRLVGDPQSKIAAAAGGVMLARRAALKKIGGLEAIKGELIDDCALAARIKETGGKICLTLTNDARSLRRYPSFEDVHDMIARTAFTQLRRSNLFLAGALLAMAVVFLSPVWAVLTFRADLMFLGGIAWFVMAALYAPMVVFYELPLVWAASLPLAALFYMVATFNSARRTWAGKGGLWKGRTHQ